LSAIKFVRKFISTILFVCKRPPVANDIPVKKIFFPQIPPLDQPVPSDWKTIEGAFLPFFLIFNK